MISQSQVVDMGEGENMNECRVVHCQTLTLVYDQMLILSYQTTYIVVLSVSRGITH